jgi:hypothetical protein
MKKTLTFILASIVLFSCTKENITSVQSDSQLTSKGGTYNCLTTTAEAASIQLLSPLSPKSWFNLSFCFTPPTQTIPNPVVYTNGDSMPVSLQIFVNKVFVGPRNQFIDEKIDEYFYQPVFHPYPTPVTKFTQKPALQNGTFTFPINFKFEKKGLYNKFINCCGAYVNDTTLYNWDAYDFGMHSQTTNSYAYVRLVIKSDKK